MYANEQQKIYTVHNTMQSVSKSIFSYAKGKKKQTEDSWICIIVIKILFRFDKPATALCCVVRAFVMCCNIQCNKYLMVKMSQLV